MVRLDDVWKTYDVGGGAVHALSGIDLAVSSGEYLAIMGQSGSGKSTMLNLLGCLDKPTSGQYWLGGKDVSRYTDAELSEVRNLSIGFVFQSFNLLPRISVLANIEVPLFYRGMPRARRRPRSWELADMVGLSDRAFHSPQELSGGQKQRVAIARALANDPLILLADEPTGNLDSATSRDIMALFDELHQRGRTILMVTHEVDIAAHASRVIHLADGKVLQDSHSDSKPPPGPPELEEMRT
ncbi:MAG: ABC transporter ATP-binding protein [bacterium]|nr:ABC transporter ATP-binding protein [bacterium]